MGRGTSSALDAAIENNPSVSGRKVERILSELTDCDDFDRLLDMLQSSGEWPHTQMKGILRHLCDHYGVDHDNLSEKAIREWRARQVNQ